MKTEVKALFQDFNAGAKKDVIKFEVKGDLTDAQIVALHKLKGGTVFVHISSEQRDIDDLEEEYDHGRAGVSYQVNGDSTVDVKPDQLSIDDVPAPQDEGPKEEGNPTENDDVLPEGHKDDEELSSDDQPSSTSANVSDIEQERKRRGRPKKDATTPQTEAVDEQSETDTPPVPLSPSDDDELPF